jgi:hypothetical protein
MVVINDPIYLGGDVGMDEMFNVFGDGHARFGGTPLQARVIHLVEIESHILSRERHYSAIRNRFNGESVTMGVSPPELSGGLRVVSLNQLLERDAVEAIEVRRPFPWHVSIAHPVLHPLAAARVTGCAQLFGNAGSGAFFLVEHFLDASHD